MLHACGHVLEPGVSAQVGMQQSALPRAGHASLRSPGPGTRRWRFALSLNARRHFGGRNPRLNSCPAYSRRRSKASRSTRPLPAHSSLCRNACCDVGPITATFFHRFPVIDLPETLIGRRAPGVCLPIRLVDLLGRTGDACLRQAPDYHEPSSRSAIRSSAAARLWISSVSTSTTPVALSAPSSTTA